jgi:hypothetical protein
MQTWEYISVADSSHNDLTVAISQLGAEGWELVSVAPAGLHLIAFLKRPKK